MDTHHLVLRGLDPRRYRHGTVTLAFGTYKRTAGHGRVVTTCDVAYNGVVVGKGVAICMPEDAFSPITGERKALASALRDFSRQTRQEVAEAYEREQVARYEAAPMSGYQAMLLEEAGYGAGV